MTVDPQQPPLPDVRVYTFGLYEADYGNPAKGAGVVIREQGCTIGLQFNGRTGDAPLIEIKVLGDPDEYVVPARVQHVIPQIDLYLALSRAAMAWQFEDARAAAEALRSISRPGRGLSPDFIRLIALNYSAIVEAGDPHPTKTLADRFHTDPSNASRWVSRARDEGYLPKKERRASHASRR